MLPSPTQLQHRQTHTVSVTVQLGDTNFTQQIGGLITFSVYRELNKIPTAKVLIADGSVADQDFPKSNMSELAPGQPITILAGYNQGEEPIFEGIIVRHSLKVLPGRPFVLEIMAKDPTIRSTLIRKSQNFRQRRDDQVIADLLGAYENVDVTVTDQTNYQHEELVQYHCTDWDFSLLRADANGLYLNVLDGTVEIKQPEVADRPDLNVHFGQGGEGIPLIEFESEIDARYHYPGVIGETWDSAQGAIENQTAGGAASGVQATPNLGSSIGIGGGPAGHDFPDALYGSESVRLHHGGTLQGQELASWVAAKEQRGQQSRMRGRVSVRGVDVKPGQTLGLAGVGDRISGNHLITGVLHQLDGGSWLTNIQFGWDAQFFAEDHTTTTPSAEGLASAIRGLQIGIVDALEGDPEPGGGRVRIRLPYVARNPDGTDATGIWARTCHLYAGDNRGFIFRPEVGDEVMVGFINEDPNDAIVLGGLHSGNFQVPSDLAPSDENPKKGFFGKEGQLQLIFDDTGKVISINAGQGGDGPKLELDGKAGKVTLQIDANNSIVIDSNGVTVKGSAINLNP